MTTSISADVLMRQECVELFLSLSFQLESLCLCLVAHSGCFFLCQFHYSYYSWITLESSGRSKISFHLFAFIFPCSHVLTSRATLTPSAIRSQSLRWLKAMFGFHLSYQGVPGMLWCAIIIVFRLQKDKTCSSVHSRFMGFQFKHQSVTTWVIQEWQERREQDSSHPCSWRGATRILYVQLL